jgi:8-hydroxy-5-deazaflavin:NADPH oxidoreductase
MSSQILTDGTPAGTDGRRALATASDSDEGIDFITALYDEFGFDTVVIGPLADSWRIERDQPGYGVPNNAAGLEKALADAVR